MCVAAMNGHAGYKYGAALARSPRGGVGVGLCQTLSTGTVSVFSVLQPGDPDFDIVLP